MRFSQVIAAHRDKCLYENHSKSGEGITDQKSRHLSTGRQYISTFPWERADRQAQHFLPGAMVSYKHIKYKNIWQWSAPCQRLSETMWDSFNRPSRQNGKKGPKLFSQKSQSTPSRYLSRALNILYSWGCIMLSSVKTCSNANMLCFSKYYAFQYYCRRNQCSNRSPDVLFQTN